MATTGLPSKSPRVSNVGPGPSATYGTGTVASWDAEHDDGHRGHDHRQNPPVHGPQGSRSRFARQRAHPWAAVGTVRVWLTCRLASPLATTPMGQVRPQSGLGGEFNMGDLGKLFNQLGEMFSGAGSAMASGGGGAVNYELARKLASSSIGFTAPVSSPPARRWPTPCTRRHLAGRGVRAAGRGHQVGGVDAAGTGWTTPWPPGSGCADGRAGFERLVDGAWTGWPQKSQRWPGVDGDDDPDGVDGVRLAAGPGAGPAVARGVDLQTLGCRWGLPEWRL